MAKQSNQKLKLLYLLKILFEETDEQSGMTISQISAELAKYNISAARKSLYDDIESLRLFGIDVQVKRDRYVRYYIAKRDISSVELKYVIDAIEQFDALVPSAGYELAQKIMRIHGMKRQVLLDNFSEPLYQTPKVVFDELTKNIELLENAISKRKKIYCRQFVWNANKQRTLINDGKPTCLTPIHLACEGKYLLYAYDGKGIAVYNVGEMIDIEVSNENAAPLDEYIRFLDDLRNSVDYENVRLECDNFFAGEIFLKFGLGVTLLSNKGDSFEISVKVKLGDDFFSWLFCNAKYVRVIAPNRVLDIYKERLLLAIDNAERR